MIKTIFLAPVALLVAVSAQAVSLVSTPGNAVPIGQHVIVDFEAPTPGVTYSGSYTIDANAVTGVRAPPAGDITKYFATPGTSQPIPGVATIDFTSYIAARGAFKSLSFYWGSIDDYNTLSLIGSGFHGHSTFSGTDINDPANGNQSAPATNRRVTFTFAPGEKLTGLTLTSGQRAFEIDNIAAAIPEPEIWGMMLLGFGLVGSAVRLRSRAVLV